MPIEVGIWRIDGAPKKLHFSPLKEEFKPEDVIGRAVEEVNRQIGELQGP